ncbi:MAG: helix-turn-helix transcriptional regulator [Calditrichaeota bacterium]|nr:helix-turn-helix transcriptional regulator [Calditrichota bacterium]
MSSPRPRKRVDEDVRRMHRVLSRNLRQLMAESNGGQSSSVLSLARATGLGTGSIQALLRDQDHSPSIRVLERVAQHFGLRGAWVLMSNMDLDREICFWLATHRLPFSMQEVDITRLVALCEPWQTPEAAHALLELAREMTLGEFRALLDRAEGLELPTNPNWTVLASQIAG